MCHSFEAWVLNVADTLHDSDGLRSMRVELLHYEVELAEFLCDVSCLFFQVYQCMQWVCIMNAFHVKGCVDVFSHGVTEFLGTKK